MGDRPRGPHRVSRSLAVVDLSTVHEQLVRRCVARLECLLEADCHVAHVPLVRREIGIETFIGCISV